MKASMRRSGANWAAALGLVMLLLAPAAASARMASPANFLSGGTASVHAASHDAMTSKETALVFNQQMRKLWEDHITWTRLVIVSFAAGLPDLGTAVDRLMQNQTDIGNAIKPFYGETAGNQLTVLLKEHISLAADLLTAAKAGDNAKVAQVSAKWYANADEIATFLHNANPKYWSLDDMKSMMKQHLDLTLQEATARLSGDWPGDVKAYDAVHGEILQMADMLSWGIVKQFPGKFR